MWAQTIVGPYSCERIEVATPTESDLVPGQVLLRVLAAGICGSDLPAFRAGALLTAPHPTSPVAGFPLHEVVGEVVLSRDPSLRVGVKVVGWATARNAAAEFAIVDGSGLAEYDETLTPTEAILLQPLACVVSALNEQLPDVAGASTAVLGLGSIGMLFAQVLKSRGARSVIGVDPVDRSDVAAAFGLDDVATMSGARWVAGMTESTARPEVVVEAVGHQVSTLTDAVQAVADRGRVLYYGVPDDPVYPFPMETFLRKNATLTAGYTRDKRAALAAAALHLKGHPELPATYITHVFGPQELQAAFERADRPARGRLKVVLAAE